MQIISKMPKVCHRRFLLQRVPASCKPCRSLSEKDVGTHVGLRAGASCQDAMCNTSHACRCSAPLCGWLSCSTSYQGWRHLRAVFTLIA